MTPPETRHAIWPPVVVLTLVQVSIAFGVLSISVLAPVLIRELGVGLGFIGTYSAILWGTSLVTIVLSGELLARFGPARMSQACCLGVALAMTVAATGSIVALAVCAAIIGLAAGPETPASSQLLMRLTTPRQRPLIFSAKQTGLPLGAMCAGFILPLLLTTISWRGTLLVIAAAAVAMAVAMEPIRRRYDRPVAAAAQPLARRSILAGVGRSLRASVTWPGILPLSLCALSYTCIQFCIGIFLVTALVDRLSYSLVQAGTVMAIMQFAAVLARVTVGGAAGRWFTPRTVMVACGCGEIVAAILLGLASPAWPAVAVVALAIFCGVTTNGWNGVQLSEVARLAPADRVGEITSGTMVFGAIGVIVGPLTFGWLAGAAGIGNAFLAFAVVPLIGLWGLRRRSDAA